MAYLTSWLKAEGGFLFHPSKSRQETYNNTVDGSEIPKANHRLDGAKTRRK